MNDNLKQAREPSTPWLKKLQRYIALNQKTRALLLLEKVIESDMPLFWDDPAIQEDRRFAWLCRIELLREYGRYSEALALTSLPFEPGEHRRIAVKIVDDRGIESLKVMEID